LSFAMRAISSMLIVTVSLERRCASVALAIASSPAPTSTTRPFAASSTPDTTPAASRLVSRWLRPRTIDCWTAAD